MRSAAKYIKIGLNIAVDAAQVAEDFEKPLCRMQSDVFVKHRPSDLKRAHKIVIAEKVFRQIFQAELADSNGRVLRLLFCEWSTLKRASRDERVRKIGELLDLRFEFVIQFDVRL